MMLFCGSHAAQGGDLSLLLNGKAVHIDVPEGEDYNEDNWGLGVQYDFVRPESKWVPFANVSEFRDSNDNVSWYAGGGSVRRFRPFGDRDAHIDLGLIGFLMYWKHFQDGRPFLGALPVLSMGTRRVALNVTYIPKVDPKMVPLLFFQLKMILGTH